MCGPALGLLGAVASAAGSIYSGMAQAAGYEASAKAKKYQAQTELDSGAYDMNIQQRRADALTAKQVTATASSGVDLWGSPSDVIQSSAIEAQMDKDATRYNAQGRYKTTMYAAQVDKMNARNARTGGFIGAIAPMVSGIGGMFG